MNDYCYVGRHADELANGRPVAPGDTVSLAADDASEPHNRRLIEEGLLVNLGDPADDGQLRGEALDARVRELEIAGASQMTAAQKRAAVAEAEANLTSEEG